MVSLDWICKNWSFINARWVKRIPYNRLRRLLRDGTAPTSGKFYGTPEFFTSNAEEYGSTTCSGSTRLCLRPYVVAPMPEESVMAVFIDPKRYEFDEDGNITSLKSLYEVPVYVFIRD